MYQGSDDAAVLLQAPIDLESSSEADARSRSSRPASSIALRSVLVVGLVLGVVVAGFKSQMNTAVMTTPRADKVTLVAITDDKKTSKDDATTASKTEETKADDTDDAKECSWIKTDCSKTKCCKEAGMQCYQQTEEWAQCRPSCTPGPDPTHWDGNNWTCKELGARTEGTAPQCSEHGPDCSDSRCCSTPGMQCFEKQPGWATCKFDCVEGVDLMDNNADPWTCKKYGDKAELAADWVAGQCSQPADDCRKTSCCAVPGQTCYKRDDFWAQCMDSCTPGPDPEKPWSDKEWSCKPLGSQTPLAPPSEDTAATVADWVADVCAKDGADCRKSGCCVGEGLQCFEKNASSAKCKASCNAGADLYDSDEKPWSCNVLGPRTPGKAKEDLGRNVSSWVSKKCAKDGEGCLDVGCCRDVGFQCYAKNEGWATCLQDCAAGENRSVYGDIDDKPWSCNEVGQRTPRPFGTPSLYCFAVVRTEGYEISLVQAQLGKSAGIFACDLYSVFSSTAYQGSGTTYWHPADEVEDTSPLVPVYLGTGPLGRLETIPFRSTYVGQSIDGTAGNSELFLRVWNKVFEQGYYAKADWTLKVDPDAVLIVTRMRAVLEPYVGQNTYIVNCDKPGMAPMMFGSVEMLSKSAVQAFADKQEDCKGGLGWKEWGEDYFLGKCFDMIGVERTNQFSAVSDGVCKGVDCGDPNAAAFHPKKDFDSWVACFDQAMR